jgi:hypothetical protein
MERDSQRIDIVFRFSFLHTPRMKNGRQNEKRNARMHSEAVIQYR